MNKKKTGLMLSVLGVLSLILITAGVTYAFFNYAKEGTTENTITTGTITFVYEEVEANGAGIGISDAYPVPDTTGKAQSGSGKIFNFTVESTTPSNASIPYIVTARMKNDSTLDQAAVKLYLTEVNGTAETELKSDIYSNLTDYENAPTGITEKVIYTDTVATSKNYEKNFRLRMWIPDTINFSQNTDGTYPYNGKTFTVTVNVYANAQVVNVANPPAVPETPVGFVPTYFAFGTPTTSSTKDYTTLGYNVFAGLGEDGSKGVCINYEELFCIKSHDYENTKASLIAYFGEDNCEEYDNEFYCDTDVVNFYGTPDGGISFYKQSAADIYIDCQVKSNGEFYCTD